MEIRKDVTQVINYLCANTGSDEYKGVKRVATRMKDANLAIDQAKRDYERIRQELSKAEMEQADALRELTEVYLKDVPCETETIILMTLKG